MKYLPRVPVDPPLVEELQVINGLAMRRINSFVQATSKDPDVLLAQISPHADAILADDEYRSILSTAKLAARVCVHNTLEQAIERLGLPLDVPRFQLCVGAGGRMAPYFGLRDGGYAHSDITPFLLQEHSISHFCDNRSGLLSFPSDNYIYLCLQGGSLDAAILEESTHLLQHCAEGGIDFSLESFYAPAAEAAGSLHLVKPLPVAVLQQQYVAERIYHEATAQAIRDLAGTDDTRRASFVRTQKCFGKPSVHLGLFMSKGFTVYFGQIAGRFDYDYNTRLARGEDDLPTREQFRMWGLVQSPTVVHDIGYSLGTCVFSCMQMPGRFERFRELAFTPPEYDGVTPDYLNKLEQLRKLAL